MERPPVIIAFLLFVLLSACKPKEWTAVAESVPNAPVTPIWVNVTVAFRKDNFQSTEDLVLEQRFAALSGRTSTYTENGVSFTLTPRSNGDHTISITATLREGAHTISHIPGVTVVDGKETTHQVGENRFIFLATTDPKFFSIVLDAQKRERDRIAGTYVQIPGGFTGCTLVLDRSGRATSHYWTDTGRPPPATQCQYTVRDETLYFFTRERGGSTMTHLVIDDVHILMDVGDLQRRPNGGECFVRIPKELEGDENWWKKLREAHPEFAKALPHG